MARDCVQPYEYSLAHGANVYKQTCWLRSVRGDTNTVPVWTKQCVWMLWHSLVCFACIRVTWVGVHTATVSRHTLCSYCLFISLELEPIPIPWIGPCFSTLTLKSKGTSVQRNISMETNSSSHNLTAFPCNSTESKWNMIFMIFFNRIVDQKIHWESQQQCGLSEQLIWLEKNKCCWQNWLQIGPELASNLSWYYLYLFCDILNICDVDL